MLRLALPALLLASLATPIAVAHHTPDCGDPLLGTEPGVTLHAEGCLGARVVTPGACMEYVHALGHDSCEYVLAVPAPVEDGGPAVCDAAPVVREDLGAARVLLAAGPGCYAADVATRGPCFGIPRFSTPIPGGALFVDIACRAHVEGTTPSVERALCREIVDQPLRAVAIVGHVTLGALCAEAWAGQSALPCPAAPTLTVPLPGGRLWLWPGCGAGVEWAAPIP